MKTHLPQTEAGTGGRQLGKGQMFLGRKRRLRVKKKENVMQKNLRGMASLNYVKRGPERLRAKEERPARRSFVKNAVWEIYSG